MKTVIAYLAAAGLMTALAGLIVFFVFWVLIGLIAFVTWTLPAVFPSVWFVVRISLAIGIVTSIFFVLSKEGKEVVDDFVKDFDSK